MESAQAQKTAKNIYPEKIYYTLILRNFLHFLKTKLFLCFKKWNFSLFQESYLYFSKWNFLATSLSNFLCFRKEFENPENRTKTPCSTLREKFPNTEFFRPVFSGTQPEYGDLWSKFNLSIGKSRPENSLGHFGHFSRSAT